MLKTDKTPKGVVAILVDKSGREIANATAFERDSWGGFTLREMHEVRARKRLAVNAVRGLSGSLLYDYISDTVAETVVRRMCEDGFRIIIVPVGHDD